MSALNWEKNFGHYSISVPVAPSSMPKLQTSLATIFVEIFFQKKIGEVLDLFELPHGRIFWYLEKNGVLKFFEQVFRPGKFSGSWASLQTHGNEWNGWTSRHGWNRYLDEWIDSTLISIRKKLWSGSLTSYSQRVCVMHVNETDLIFWALCWKK